MAEKNTQSLRKLKNTAANLARHEANAARVALLGLPPETSDHVKTRTGPKGTYTVTVTKRVRESKLLRKFDRAKRLAAKPEAIVPDIDIQTGKQ
jgi:hypothetical protein